MTRGCWPSRHPRVRLRSMVAHAPGPRGPAGALARTLCAAVLLACALVRPASAQEQPPAGEAEAARVFLDCGYRCDEDFLRSEITYVNWVRDRAVADVHLLVTTQSTGGGGTEFTLAFLGQQRFPGLADTLRYVAPATHTADDTRRGLGRMIALGLARFVARTEAAQRLTITGKAAAGAETAQASPAHDPWNHWTFRINANTNFNGERSYESRYYYASLTASRITEAWKLTLTANQSQNMSRFVFEDADGSRTAFESFRRSLGFNTLAVKSLTAHWSAGVRGSITSSTYYNQDANLSLIPSVEYNIFPYSQSTRRQLRLQYGVGGRSLQYQDTTIYGRIAETKPLQSASVALDLRQPWGSTSLSMDAQQYLDQPRYYRWSTYGSANVRLFKGLGLNLFGGYERLRDQIYISAQGATRDEILTRQRQLETGFYYYGGIGLSYTFGSIYNNIVNPRFGGSGGGTIIMF